jgi:hypothetical protein
MYSTVYIYETHFQKSVIDHLIDKDEINTANILIIDAINHKLKIESEVFNFNFNKIRMLVSSLRALIELKKMNISCETLVSTHITGLNALFFSSFIKAEKKILIDDGIGTPVLLMNHRIFKYKIKFQIRYFFIKSILFFLFLKLKSIKNTLKTISQYSTVYKKTPTLTKHFFIVKHLNFYLMKYEINQGEVCFIGAPLLEFKLCNQQSYEKLLKSVRNKYGNFIYYLHPDEQLVLSLNIDGIKFEKLNVNIESFFYEMGVPKTVIGFASSVLLNLSNSSYIQGNVNFRYIKKKVYGLEYDKLYYEVLECNNIIDSGISFRK